MIPPLRKIIHINIPGFFDEFFNFGFFDFFGLF